MTDPKISPCAACGAKNRVPRVAVGAPRCAKCKTPLAWIADANDSDFDEIANSTKILVLVDLWAPWCGPCRTVSPMLEQLASDYAGRLKLVKVNVDDAPRTQARFAVQGIPTLIMFNGGQEIDRLIGAHPMAKLRAWIEETAKSPR